MVVIQDDLRKHLEHCLKDRIVVFGHVGVLACFGTK